MKPLSYLPLVAYPLIGSVFAQDAETGYRFELESDRGAITSLKHQGDRFPTDYIRQGERFGDWVIRARAGDQPDWDRIETAALASENADLDLRHQADGTFSAAAIRSVGDGELALAWGVTLSGDDLLWRIELTNSGELPLEIGDLGFPVPSNSTNHPNFSLRVLQHSHIAGDGSYVFWTRWTTEPPYLLMLPEAGTALEYYRRHPVSESGTSLYHAYVHSRGQKEVIADEGGRWRWEHTSATIEPGQSLARGFRLSWADGYDDVRARIAAHGLVDVEVAPGMTVPSDLEALIALRSSATIHGIEPEFPEQTEIELLSEEDGQDIHRVRMRRLGENTLTVHFGEGQKQWIEFFVTEPLETLINKRARFIVERQQIRDESKWYDGLLSDWSMKDEVLLTPDEPHDIPASRRYMIASDDPGLSRPAFLAAKNAEFPVQEEVSALDYYIENFVWGGLQMTPEETYPYAIYGIPNWYANRNSPDPRQYRRSRVFRAYDYPHIMLMYHGMYRVAKNHPSIETRLTAEEYLDRAYQTAIAFFIYPVEVYDGHPAYQHETGYFNEVLVNQLLEDLEETGREDEAHRLRRHWEKKINYFVAGNPRLFYSEYGFDTTGFESTHALAQYADAHVDRPADPLLAMDVTREQVDAFMRHQIDLNVGARGWLEPHYYTYGSDYRRTNAGYLLSYMSQMGGWAILDHSLHYAADPHEHLKLGYGSILSSWALMNTGTDETGFGYWYPGEINDGGAGGGFEPEAYGSNWLTNPHSRGSWYYGCEIDLGFCGFLRAGRTVLTNDPTFGPIALGGSLERNEQESRVEPRDGIRRRFHVIRPEANQRFHLELIQDRFAAGREIRVHHALDYVGFTLERSDAARTEGEMILSGLPEGGYEVHLDGEVVHELYVEPHVAFPLVLRLGDENHEILLLRK